MNAQFADSYLLERRFGFDRGRYPQNLLKRRVFILPTRHGVLFGIMLMIMLLGAINYDNNLAYMLTFLLSSLTLVAIFFTYRNIAGLILTAQTPTPVFAGDYARFPIRVDNHQQGQRYSLQFINQVKAKHWFRRARVIGDRPIFDIAADRLEQLSIELKSQRRGMLEFGRLQITSSFPLGLFQAWSNCDFGHHCIVYPAAKGQLPFPVVSLREEQGSSSHNEGNEDFVGLRRYRQGDSSRQIDWKAYARERGLNRKLFQGSADLELIFDWNDVKRLGDVEAGLSQLCAWILQAEERQHRYGLTLGETRIAPGRGPAHRHQCLSALALYGL